MANSKLRLVAALCLSYIAVAHSAEPKQGSNKPFILTQSGNGEWQLEARQANLPKLLDEIALRTSTHLHYTVLPDTPVDATCISSSISGLLQCVLGSGVNLASRQLESASTTSGVTHQNEEIWIMGTSLARAVTSRQCIATAPSTHVENAKADLTEQWLRQAAGKDPAQRAQAVAELANANQAFDAEVKSALQKALNDSNGQVRAQAISALASREGEAAASEQLHQALSDSNADVRLMAVDNIEQDVTLLQLALQDKEAAVRQLAEIKLEQLSRQ